MHVKLKQDDKLVETRTSRIYLKDNLVYKLKRSVSDHFVDYSTQEQRRAALSREFDKGSAYSPSLYRALVEVKEPDSAQPEPAICMNYLAPPYRTCFAHLQLSTSEPISLEQLLQKVRAFHSQTRAYDMTGGALAGLVPLTMGQRFQLMIEETELLGVHLPRAFKESSRKFVGYYEARYEERLRAGAIRQLHGDLHSDNVIFNDDDFVFFDFLDFEESFTTGDIALDLGFLAADLFFFEERARQARLLLLIESLFEIEAEIILPLIGFGALNRANTFRMSARDSHLADGYYGLAVRLMERYASSF